MLVLVLTLFLKGKGKKQQRKEKGETVRRVDYITFGYSGPLRF